MIFFEKKPRHYEQHRNNYSIPHKIRPVQENIEIFIFSNFLIWILNIYSNSKEIIFIFELYNCIKLGENHQVVWEAKHRFLYFWNNYSKLALKNYTKGLPHSVRISWKKFETFTKIIKKKNCFGMSSDFLTWDSLKKTVTYMMGTF